MRLKRKLITSMAGSLEDGSTTVITNGRDWAHKYLGLKLILCHVSKLVQCECALPVQRRQNRARAELITGHLPQTNCCTRAVVSTCRCQRLHVSMHRHHC